MATSMLSAPISGEPSTSRDTVSCATKLCERCQKIPFDDGKYGGFTGLSHAGSEYLKLDDDDRNRDLRVDFELVDSWPDLDILSTSAETCGFCNLLRLGLKDSGFHVPFKRGWVNVKLIYLWRTMSQVIPPYWYALDGLDALVFGTENQDKEFEILTRLRCTIDAVDGPCQRWLRLRTTPPLGLLCEENISRIAALLKESNATHGTTFFPTRVLDLEYQAKEGEAPLGRMRLVTKEEVFSKVTPQIPPYVALSYCWGPVAQASTQSTTTNNNIRERTMNIDLQTVSMVIQDVVTVCRVFRVRYLWVDALCIIQGNVQDWERESSTMGELYSNAYFTIGAASSNSCDDSFLSKSLPTIEFPFSSSMNAGAKGTYRVVARGHRYHSLSTPSIFMEFEDIDGSWMNRGWVFQERYLSRRLLMFGGNMVHAEFERASTLFSQLKSLDYGSWRTLLCEYTGSKLTFERDRLPAISGLAKLYTKALGDQYLAGMWRKDLHISLFWAIEPEHHSLNSLIESLEAPHPYIAPSWSWARQDNQVDFGLRFDGFWVEQLGNNRSKFNIIEAGCTTIGLNAFGEISGGFIVLSAKVSALKFDLAAARKYYYQAYHINGMPIADFELDWGLGDETIRQRELLLVLLGSCRDDDAEPCYCGRELSVSKASEEPMLDEDEDEPRDELSDGETLCASHDLDLADQKHSEKADDNAFNEEKQEDSDGSSGPDEEDTNTSGSDGEQFCQRCFEAPENQCAYGLVLYPAKTAGQFYRVGLFASQPIIHAPHGGLKFCEEWETETITII